MGTQVFAVPQGLPINDAALNAEAATAGGSGTFDSNGFGVVNLAPGSLGQGAQAAALAAAGAVPVLGLGYFSSTSTTLTASAGMDAHFTPRTAGGATWTLPVVAAAVAGNAPMEICIWNDSTFQTGGPLVVQTQSSQLIQPASATSVTLNGGQHLHLVAYGGGWYGQVQG